MPTQTKGLRVFVKPTVTRRAPRTQQGISLDALIADLNGLSGEGGGGGNNSGNPPPSGWKGRGGRWYRSIIRTAPWVAAGLYVLDVMQSDRPEEWVPHGGWSIYRQCATPSGSYNGPWGLGSTSGLANSPTIGNFTTSCLAGQGTTNVGDPWAGVGTGARSVGIGKTTVVGGSPRVQFQIAFTRPNTGTVDPPTLSLARATAALPSVKPGSWVITAFPEMFPPQMAPAFPAPVPWRYAPHVRSPNRDAGYSVGNGMSNLPPSMRRNVWATSITAVSASGGGFGRPPRFHETTSPDESKRPEKERKARVNKYLMAIMRGANAVTEGKDLVEALYKALPEEFRPRYKDTIYEQLNTSPQEKLKALWDNWGAVDIEDAIYNIADNYLEDFVYGSIGKLGGAASRQAGLPVGLGFNGVAKRFSNFEYASRKNRTVDE